jgi:hypothetical protein
MMWMLTRAGLFGCWVLLHALMGSFTRYGHAFVFCALASVRPCGWCVWPCCCMPSRQVGTAWCRIRTFVTAHGLARASGQLLLARSMQQMCCEVSL